ncbi:MAG: succinylglutamate desuccinylase/aspartoacylase family protein [Alphaproteobacteria bacterium]|jgi:predicted deacylase|nr:succinylglutamate desuccinylase/aspartoacylase family protein [Candidatus Jidaibacter sp.]
MAQADVLKISDTEIKKGQRVRIEIPIAKLFDYTSLNIPVEVIRGAQDGPTLFVSAAIHGDEIIGAEIVKRILARKELADIKGTLIAIPIVNPFGFNNNTRYLPDRRDLNRCFPGSPTGSLAARMAHTFLSEIVSKCDYGIDIHSGAVHRFNFPQVRMEIRDEEEARMAQAFGAPVVINSPLRAGTLRQAAYERGIKTILYEAGEALRFDDHAINIGIHGVLRVMQELDMLDRDPDDMPNANVMIAKSSHWIRAPESGSLRILKKFGSFVDGEELLGVLTDPFGSNVCEVRAKTAGIIIGATTMPLVNRGNALFHIATLEDLKFAGEAEESQFVLDSDVDIENEDWIKQII